LIDESEIKIPILQIQERRLSGKKIKASEKATASTPLTTCRNGLNQRRQNINSDGERVAHPLSSLVPPYHQTDGEIEAIEDPGD